LFLDLLLMLLLSCYSGYNTTSSWKLSHSDCTIFIEY